MFTVEIRINGSMIGHIYGRNVGEVGKGKHEYHYEYYEPENRTVVKNTVVHDRKKSIRKLITTILNDIP